MALAFCSGAPRYLAYTAGYLYLCLEMPRPVNVRLIATSMALIWYTRWFIEASSSFCMLASSDRDSLSYIHKEKISIFSRLVGATSEFVGKACARGFIVVARHMHDPLQEP